MLQQYIMFQMFYLSFVAANVFMLQVASVISGCCICFHSYVSSVFSKGFICRRMLHLSVSCFSESQGRVAWYGHRGMGHGALRAGDRGHDGARQMDGGRSNQGERGELRASHTDTTMAQCTCRQGELADDG
jgi:hypothetical protein